MPSEKALLDVISIQTEIARLGLDLGGVMNVVCERTLALVDADGAAIELAEDDVMVYRATAGNVRGELGLRIPADGSLSGLCVRSGEAQCCLDAEIDPRVDRAACQRIGLRSMVVIPLRHHEATVGVLKALSTQPNRFRAGELQLLALLSDVVGSAMYHATRSAPEDLFYRATHDEMTGLANRALFMDRLRGAIARKRRERTTAGVVVIDMDGLKTVNDRFGHRTGDAVIREFAQRIRLGARQSDTVARLGGDEFGLLLTPVDLPDGLVATIGRINANLQAPFVFEQKTYRLDASIGVAEFPVDGDSIDGLLEKADQRMYQAKQARRLERGRQLN